MKKYPNLPMFVYRQQNGHYKNTKTGEWMTEKELDYYNEQPEKIKTTECKPAIKEYWWQKL